MAEFSDLWIIGMILAAFAGGAFGAAIGALPAFVFTGFMVMLGEGIRILSGDLSGLVGFDPDTIESANITGQLAFGPVFGPHISFAGGAAAAAYAAKKGYMQTGFPYHQSKNIGYALGPKPDVLLVGGLFGILGYWIATLFSIWSMPWDGIALTVVISAFAHRLFLGYSLMGDAKKGRMNMKPFLEMEKKDDDSGRFLVEPWLGHQYKYNDVLMIGLVVGILAVYITVVTGSVFMPFGISAASLIFLNLGVERIPVTHHISLVASTAAVAFAGGDAADLSLTTALLIGAAAGMLAAWFGEVTQRLFYAHADTHLDPPAFAIAIGTFLVAVLAMLGWIESSAWVPLPF
jgi:hypothetical protein